MKPDWDKLAKKFKTSETVTVADVDCTAAGESICQKIGVQGYPTIKYWMAGNRKANDYNGGRSYAELEKFTKKTFKAGCNIETKKDCTDEQKGYVDKYSGMTEEQLTAEIEALVKTAEDEAKKRADFAEEGKAKIKEFKDKEDAVGMNITLCGKYIETTFPDDHAAEQKAKEEAEKKKKEAAEAKRKADEEKAKAKKKKEEGSDSDDE